MDRTLMVRLLPNTRNKVKWYYNNDNSIGKTFKVEELEDEPVFENSYRLTDSLFFDKEDCEIIKDYIFDSLDVGDNILYENKDWTIELMWWIKDNGERFIIEITRIENGERIFKEIACKQIQKVIK